TGNTVPSDATTDGASLTSSGISTGLVGAQMVIAYAPGFLASLAVPLGFTVEDAQRASDAAQSLLPAALIFGLVGFGLGTYNLIQGIRKKKRYHDLSHKAEQLLFANAETRAMLAAAGIQPPAAGPAGGPGHGHGSDHDPSGHDHSGHDHSGPDPARAAGHWGRGPHRR
ncbi:MAG TPA: hypothetical protein VL025_15510, partial [Thermoanaerobaculia bacterium]|nr:hypothetical protein [Thermoanaerobaculia bacterium]